MSDLRTTLPNLHEALSELLWDTEDRPSARQPPARRSTPALCVVRWRLLLKSARCQGRKRCALRLPKALLASALVMLRRACGCRRVERRGPWHWPRRCYSPLGRSWCRLPGFRPTSRLRRHPRHRRLTHWPFPTQLPPKRAHIKNGTRHPSSGCESALLRRRDRPSKCRDASVTVCHGRRIRPVACGRRGG